MALSVSRSAVTQSFVTAALLILSATVDVLLAAEPVYITGKVVKIADGDTLTVLDDQKVQHRIRLHGIDAPEKAQGFSAKSKENLSRLAHGKQVRAEVRDVDRYKRKVAVVTADGTNVNATQVRDGFAWRFTQYDKRNEFGACETEARDAKRGLWADKNPQPPWEYRKQQRESSKAAKARR